MDIFKQAGFSQVKRWYQAQNLGIRNGTDFLNMKDMSQTTVEAGNTAYDQKDRQRLEPELQEAIRDTYDELSGANTADERTLEVMIILAFKD